MQQPYISPILHWQYHACWCSGDCRSQGISMYGIDPKSQNIQSPASEELIMAGNPVTSLSELVTISHNYSYD